MPSYILNYVLGVSWVCFSLYAESCIYGNFLQEKAFLL